MPTLRHESPSPAFGRDLKLERSEAAYMSGKLESGQNGDKVRFQWTRTGDDYTLKLLQGIFGKAVRVQGG